MGCGGLSDVPRFFTAGYGTAKEPGQMPIREPQPTAPSQLLIIIYELRMGEPPSRYIKPANNNRLDGDRQTAKNRYFCTSK